MLGGGAAIPGARRIADPRRSAAGAGGSGARGPAGRQHGGGLVRALPAREVVQALGSGGCIPGPRGAGGSGNCLPAMGAVERAGRRGRGHAGEPAPPDRGRLGRHQASRAAWENYGRNSARGGLRLRSALAVLAACAASRGGLNNSGSDALCGPARELRERHCRAASRPPLDRRALPLTSSSVGLAGSRYLPPAPPRGNQE